MSHSHRFRLESSPSARFSSSLSSRSVCSNSPSSMTSLPSLSSSTSSTEEEEEEEEESSLCSNRRPQVCRSKSTSILRILGPERRQGSLTFTTSTNSLKRAGSSRCLNWKSMNALPETPSGNSSTGVVNTSIMTTTEGDHDTPAPLLDGIP